MAQLDELLREFRADVPPPAPGAEERIVARAATAERPAARSQIGRRVALVAAGIAAAVTLVVALVPGGDGGSGSSVATLLERAEAAVTPRERILALTISIRATDPDPAVVPEDEQRLIRMREYVLAGAGDALALRVLITEGPWSDPPTDEDSTILIDRDGKLVEHRSWTPWGNPGDGGRLEVRTRLRGPRRGRVDPTVSGVLRAAYEDGALRPVGDRSGGEVRLRGHLFYGECGSTEVWLDPGTFIPRRIEIAFGRTARNGRCAPDAPTGRQIWTIASRRLEPNERNLRLLGMGDWPVSRYELNGKRVAPGELPPRPELDEG